MMVPPPQYQYCLRRTVLGNCWDRLGNTVWSRPPMVYIVRPCPKNEKKEELRKKKEGVGGEEGRKRKKDVPFPLVASQLCVPLG